MHSAGRLGLSTYLVNRFMKGELPDLENPGRRRPAPTDFPSKMCAFCYLIQNMPGIIHALCEVLMSSIARLVVVPGEWLQKEIS